MAGQLWAVQALGGYMSSDKLSDILRTAVQPLMRFRSHCDISDAVGKNKGDIFHWNVYSDVADEGGELNEQLAMPETNFDIDQGSMRITEYGNSVPYTGKLDDLSEHPVKEIINKVMRRDCAKTLDRAAHRQFDATVLTVAPTGGNNASAVTLEVGDCTITNNIALGKDHVKSIVDAMKERDIPAYDGANYMAIGRPSSFRAFKDDLEDIKQYTPEGFGQIQHGEVGRYEGVRFQEQTNIGSEAWTNSKSDAVWFMGEDTVQEGIAIPEEIRGKLPGDYGRSKGVAWYYLGGFAIVHNQADGVQNRIVKWDSAA